MGNINFSGLKVRSFLFLKIIEAGRKAARSPNPKPPEKYVFLAFIPELTVRGFRPANINLNHTPGVNGLIKVLK